MANTNSAFGLKPIDLMGSGANSTGATKYFIKSDAYIVSHREASGLAQFDSKMCGTKIVTTKEFSSHSALLSGEHTHELWSFEEGNQSFIDAVEKCLERYDKKEVQQISLQAYNDELFVKNMVNDLWEVEYKEEKG